MKSLIDKIKQSGKNFLIGSGLGVGALALNSCDTPGQMEMLSAQGYYAAAENNPQLKPQQREGLIQLGNIMENQANYEQGAAIAREGKSEVNVTVNVPQNQVNSNQTENNSKQNQSRSELESVSREFEGTYLSWPTSQRPEEDTSKYLSRLNWQFNKWFENDPVYQGGDLKLCETIVSNDGHSSEAVVNNKTYKFGNRINDQFWVVAIIPAKVAIEDYHTGKDYILIQKK